MGTVFVRPIAGVLVRTPTTMTPLPEAGAQVSLDGNDGKFWRRRIADGSVVVVNAAAAAAEPASAVVAPVDHTESADRTSKGGRNR
jgi:hypothetical protein